MSYWYSPRVKRGRKCLIFYAPKGPRSRRLLTMYLSLCISLGRRPRPRSPTLAATAAGRLWPQSLHFSASFMEPQIKTPWLEEGGLPEPGADDPRAELFPRRRPWRAHGGGGRAGAGSPPGPLAAGPRDGIRAARDTIAQRPPAT